MTQTIRPVSPASEGVTSVAEAPQSPAARVQDSATRAATQVDGVHALGSPGGRAVVRALGRVPGGRPFYSPGVSVEVGPRSVALDVSLVLEYGARAVDVADKVRAAVDAGVAKDTGLDVVEVNVTVADVHHPDDDVLPEPEPAVVVPEPREVGRGSEGPQVVVADEVVIADRVVVVGEHGLERES